MTHTYTISGMTCMGCVQNVQEALEAMPETTSVKVTLDPPEAVVSMSSHISTEAINQAIGPKYSASMQGHQMQHSASDSIADIPKDATTYKPLILILLFLLGIVAISQVNAGGFYWMDAMRVFMGGFFLVFSFFKFLDLRGFADAYQGYDIVARRWRGWGYLYPFAELSLGVAYLMYGDPIAVNLATLIIMSVSIIGVLQSVLNKRAIRCACLGTVFNLPMSTVTIIEDGLMIVMAAAMLIAQWV